MIAHFPFFFHFHLSSLGFLVADMVYHTEI